MSYDMRKIKFDRPWAFPFKLLISVLPTYLPQHAQNAAGQLHLLIVTGRLNMNKLLLLTILFSSGLYAQQPVAKQYTVKDGLAGGTVYQCVQDKTGYIWFATNQGVSRFDGNSFKNFKKEDGLPDNDIIKMYVDSHNSVWFISMVGTPSVYRQGLIRSLPGCENVNAVVEDVEKNRIFLISALDKSFGYYESANQPGQWQFKPTIKTIQAFRSIYNWPVLRYSNQKGMKIYFSQNETSLICKITSNGAEKNYSCRYGNYTTVLPFGSQSFFSISEREQAVVFHTMDSVYFSNIASSTGIQSLSELGVNIGKENDISSIYYEDNNRLWIATRNHGLICIRNFLKPEKTIEHYFQNSFCTSLLRDREGGYWVTTYYDGVFYIPNLNFRTVLLPSAHQKTDIRCIRTIQGTALVAGSADGSILKINPKTKQFKKYDEWGAKNRNNRVLDIFPGKDDVIFVATDKGLYSVTSRQKVKQLTAYSSKGIVADADNNVLVALANGVEEITARERKIIFEKRATCITAIAGTYYWGTLRGLYSYNSGKVSNLGRQYPELSQIINHVGIAPDSAVWVSTQQGVIVIRNNRIFRLTKSDGLSGNTCKHISFDKNTAWVSTDNGIARVDFRWKNEKLLFSVTTITEDDGLVSNDVNQTALSDDQLWVATSAGVSFLPKNFINGSPYNPAINISKINIGKSEIPLSDTILIKPDENLAIELAGMSYRSGRDIRYEYRLLKSKKQWSQLPNNKIEFTTLPFGTVNLEIRAVDRWGKKSKQPAVITLINKPPFWKSVWFQVLSYLTTAILMGALVYSYAHRRQKKREKEYNNKRKFLELEMMALKAQINPHFIFNCLSSVQHYILKSEPEYGNEYLHKLSTLIRKTLQSSASPNILLSEEVSIIHLYLELQKLRLEDRFDYVIDFAKEQFQEGLTIPSMIIQPFVENAVKHGVSLTEGKKGMVRVTFEKTAHTVTCIIEDNGQGINASKNVSKNVGEETYYTGMGNTITEKRIAAMNSMHEEKIILQVQDKSESDPIGEGTIVKITFELKASEQYENSYYRR